MLFNSHVFLFGFLPVVLAMYFLLARRQLSLFGSPLPIVWLFVASLVFYAWWEPIYVWLILGSLSANFIIGHHVLGRSDLNDPLRRIIAGLGIAANLVLLGYFKYADFFIANLNSVGGIGWHPLGIALPLAISFFTFEQISYLVDSYRRITQNDDFFRYGLFVAFFPHLIAGPIVRQVEIVGQFEAGARDGFKAEHFAEGLALFALGLFKKAVLADGIAVHASPVFAAAADPAQTLTFFEAWIGALGYTLQIYFDFSGYSDMALGLARMMNLRLPLNFDSPYKSTSIIDFWRRWHMSLSRFLRDYLYVWLGGNRHGPARRYANLMATMLLGGLWHGAAWTFVAWGALHGLYLVINHAWRAIAGRILPASVPASLPYRLLAWAMTLLAVIVAWVFFRASSFESALRLLKAMSGADGAMLPSYYAAELGARAQWLSGLGVSFGNAPLFSRQAVMWIVALLAIALLLPNSQEWIGRSRAALADDRMPGNGGMLPIGWLGWRPGLWSGLACGLWSGLACGLLGAVAVLAMTGTSEFLYFQF